MTLSEFNDRVALIDYILDKLKPITDGRSFCDDCGRFLEPSEVKYASGFYCTNHVSSNLSIQETKNAYVKVVEDLVETLKEWREEE